MYTQFFGNFLLSKGYITNEQLFDALKEKAQKHAKLEEQQIDQLLKAK